MDKLIKVRSEIKKRKPTYTRQQTNQFKKFQKDGWRRPKGLQSKMRLKRKGHKRMPEVGFKSPKAVRGLNKDGLLEVVVKNIKDLKTVDTKTQIAVIGGTVGGKKRIDILNEAKKMKITFANVKDIDTKIKELTKVSTAKPKKEKLAKIVKETKEEAPKKEAKANVEDKK